MVDWSDKGAGLYCRDLNDKLLWFILNEPNNPFTNLFVNNAKVEVVKWDVGTYSIKQRASFNIENFNINTRKTNLFRHL